MKIVVLGAQPEWLSGLRGPMIRNFVARGHEVTAIGSEDIPHVRQALESWGVRYCVVPIRRAGLNPVADAKAIVALFNTLRRLKPDLLFAYTVKPIVYGLPVARLAGVARRYAMVTGRGYAFQDGTETSRKVAKIISMPLYRFGLRRASGVLFQNNDDAQMFRDLKLLPMNASVKRIWGSGVDLEHHHPVPLPDGPITFLMIGRLIADKGVREYVEAARQVKKSNPEARFVLVGPSDPSPNGVSSSEIAAWKMEGVIDYRGASQDVRDEISACHVLVLPSYAEGLPRSVLEAMAAGRAIITTQAPGCSDTVVEGQNGYLVPVRDAGSIASAMIKFINNPAQIETMGAASLAFARKYFDVEKVNEEIANFISV